MKKSFNFRNSEMLLAAKTVSESFVENIDELSQFRTNWTRDYAEKLRQRIDYGIDNYIEMDPRKQLRDATAHLISIQVPALKDLSAIMVQIKVDFPDEADKILRELGFSTNYSKATKHNSQEELIQLLKGFQKGMTQKLRKKIESKGVNPALIDRLIGFADSLMVANTRQEFLKESSKKVSEEATIYMNEIYNEVIGICKIAKGVFDNDPILRNQFTFSKVVRNMNSTHRSTASDVNVQNDSETTASDLQEAAN